VDLPYPGMPCLLLHHCQMCQLALVLLNGY